MNSRSTSTEAAAITVVLTDELRKKLEAAAKLEDRSLGGVVRQALKEYFAKTGAAA